MQPINHYSPSFFNNICQGACEGALMGITIGGIIGVGCSIAATAVNTASMGLIERRFRILNNESDGSFIENDLSQHSSQTNIFGFDSNMAIAIHIVGISTITGMFLGTIHGAVKRTFTNHA
jgi:hypothetical protein